LSNLIKFLGTDSFKRRIKPVKIIDPVKKINIYPAERSCSSRPIRRRSLLGKL